MVLLDVVSEIGLKNCWLLAVGILIFYFFFIILMGELFSKFLGGLFCSCPCEYLGLISVENINFWGNIEV